MEHAPERPVRLPTSRPFGRLIDWWLNPEADINIRAWWTIAGGLLVIGAVLKQPVLGMMALAIAVIGLVLRLWWDHALSRLTYSRHFSQARASWGDTVPFELTLQNAKPLPISRCEIREGVTPHVQISGYKTEASMEHQSRVFRSVYSLGLYEQVTHRYVLECHRRGWHRFGPVGIVCEDPFGMVTRRTVIDRQDGVLVYPRTVPISEIVVPARQPIGDFKPATPLVEDPMRMSGIRQYVPGDSPKRIHWRATARTGELQTRVYEASATPSAALFLDTRTFAYLWEGQQTDMLELAIVLTASISRQMLENKYQVGIFANAPIPGHSRSVRIPPSRRPGHLTHILEHLAQLAPAIGSKIDRMLSEEILKLPWGASVVLITARLDGDMQRTLLRFSRTATGKRFVVVHVGDEPNLLPEFRTRFTVWNLPGEEAWDAIEQIRLTRIA